MTRKSSLLSLAFLLTCGVASGAFAQDDGLDDVTLEVLDDVSEIDAVILAIDEQLDQEREDGERAGRDREDGSEERAADRGVEHEDSADAVRDEDPSEHDERAEGDLEDHDVEEDLEHEHDPDVDEEEGEA
jgi:hypothetical protein